MHGANKGLHDSARLAKVRYSQALLALWKKIL